MKLKRTLTGILTFILIIGAFAFLPATQVSAAGGPKLSAKSLTLNPGAVRTLTVSGGSGSVKWSTSNKKAVSIKKNGNKATITAKKKGTATITARIGEKKLRCRVKVSGKKVLIAYFSRTGNSRKVAKYIQKSVGGDLVQIKTKNPYPSDYDKCVSQAEKELEDDIRPEITTKVKNFAQYDEVVIGYPIWWGEAPRIVSTFVESYDFSDKTVIPFCTSGGSGIGSSSSNLEQLTSGSEWLAGRKLGGSDSKDVIMEWVNSLGLDLNGQ